MNSHSSPMVRRRSLFHLVSGFGNHSLRKQGEVTLPVGWLYGTQQQQQLESYGFIWYSFSKYLMFVQFKKNMVMGTII